MTQLDTMPVTPSWAHLSAFDRRDGGGTAMAIWYKIELNIFRVCLLELSFTSETVFLL